MLCITPTFRSALAHLCPVDRQSVLRIRRILLQPSCKLAQRCGYEPGGRTGASRELCTFLLEYKPRPRTC